MLEYFVKGGPVMYVILMLSIYALGVFIERMWHLSAIRMDTDLLVDDVGGFVGRRELGRAEELVRKLSGPLPAILREGLSHLSRGVGAARDAMVRKGEIECRRVEGNTRHLAIVSNLATMLGLLGTITGMIGAFTGMAAKGLGDPNAVSGGIAEALLTTAYGLMVAIPAVMAYNYLDGRVDAVRIDCEEKTSRFLDALETIEKGA